MFSFNSPSIRYTGRWSTKGMAAAVTTAPGSYMEISFEGDSIFLYFDILFSNHPLPHIYISVDNGAFIETAVDRYIRIKAERSGKHFLKILYKGGMGMHHRWYFPLDGKIAFWGYEADGEGILPEDKRMTIEFVGDSITEGVLIFDDLRPDKENEQKNRIYQDDNTETYAYLLAAKAGLKAYFNAYGAVGATKGGFGGVPKAALAYPYCFAGALREYPSPDYFMLNHGTNDRGASIGLFKTEYLNLLNVIRELNKKSVIFAVTPFCGAFVNEIKECVKKHNADYKDEIVYIDASGIIPAEPVHPDRKSHKIMAEWLFGEIRPFLNIDCPGNQLFN